MEVKKKKSEITLHQTETNESHSKFVEMQNQIQCLTTEIKHLKTCSTLFNRYASESAEIAEQNPETAAPFFPRNHHLAVNIVHSKEEKIQQSCNLHKTRRAPLQITEA